MARVNCDPNYESNRHGRCSKERVEEILKASGVDLFNGGVLKNFDSFNSTFRSTKLLCLMDCTQIESF